jgi:hypothetical protein
VDLLDDRVVPGALQAGVAVGVVAHLVALGGHPGDQILVAGDLLADEEEGGGGPPLAQTV